MLNNNHKITIGTPRLTRFEYARVLGARALQISMGAPLLIELGPDDEESDPLLLAVQEIKAGAVPISIRRLLPDGTTQDIPLIWLLAESRLS